MKPENILIDSTGHIKLTDFGLSKGECNKRQQKWIANYLNEEQKGCIKPDEKSEMPKKLPNSKKKGIVGTPYYIAPEIISGKEASFDSDWWALGVMLFEMLVGEPPYNGDSAEEIFKNILEDNKRIVPTIGYDEGEIYPEAYSLISSLMEKEPEKRLGHNGANEIKNHLYFKGINWETLRNEKPPFVPKAKNMKDTSYFSAKRSPLFKEIIPQRAQSTEKLVLIIHLIRLLEASSSCIFHDEYKHNNN